MSGPLSRKRCGARDCLAYDNNTINRPSSRSNITRACHDKSSMRGKCVKIDEGPHIGSGNNYTEHANGRANV